MQDTFTETTTRSWGNRLGSSLKGILVGVLLAIASFPLLWWNEGRAIDRAKTLAAGRDSVVSIAASPVDPANDGALAHMSGLATTDEQLRDPQFGVTAGAIKLRRSVEMYQWVEDQSSKTTQNLGGSETTETTYSYRQRWTDQLVDSSRFRRPSGHENPASMPYQSEVFEATKVTVGDFILGQSFISQLTDYKTIPFSDGAAPDGFRPHGPGLYRGSPDRPKVGDIQVRFEVVAPARVSLVGRQNGDEIVAAVMPRGRIALIEPGLVEADAMFSNAEAANRTLTWLIRAGGILLMWIGLSLVLSPLKVLADVVPLIGRIVGAGTGLIAGMVALGLGLITIALAWVFYRPLLAAALLGAALAALAAVFLKARRRAEATTAVSRPSP